MEVDAQVVPMQQWRSAGFEMGTVSCASAMLASQVSDILKWTNIRKTWEKVAPMAPMFLAPFTAYFRPPFFRSTVHSSWLIDGPSPQHWVLVCISAVLQNSHARK